MEFQPLTSSRNPQKKLRGYVFQALHFTKTHDLSGLPRSHSYFTGKTIPLAGFLFSQSICLLNQLVFVMLMWLKPVTEGLKEGFLDSNKSRPLKDSAYNYDTGNHILII